MQLTEHKKYLIARIKKVKKYVKVAEQENGKESFRYIFWKKYMDGLQKHLKNQLK